MTTDIQPRSPLDNDSMEMVVYGPAYTDVKLAMLHIARVTAALRRRNESILETHGRGRLLAAARIDRELAISEKDLSRDLSPENWRLVCDLREYIRNMLAIDMLAERRREIILWCRVVGAACRSTDKRLTGMTDEDWKQAAIAKGRDYPITDMEAWI